MVDLMEEVYVIIWRQDIVSPLKVDVFHSEERAREFFITNFNESMRVFKEKINY